MLGRAVALAVALAAVGPPVAHAGTATMRVHSERICEFGDCYVEQADIIEFTARPGELNDVRVSVSRTRVVIEDRGAPLTAGSGCARLDERRARCRVLPRRAADVFSVSATASLGDGADRATVLANGHPEAEVYLYGDAGDDALSAAATAFLKGGEGADTLTGSRFADDLEGGMGPDTLRGGAGDDVLRGEATLSFQDPQEPDVLDGGPGLDRADFDADSPIDLEQPVTAGGDRLIAVESLHAPNTSSLRGDARDNLLEGEGELLGRDGDDALFGGTLADGGAGDDRFILERGTEVRCGAGTDTVEFDNGSLRAIPEGCERGSLYGLLDVPLHAPRRTTTTLTIAALTFPVASRPRFFGARDDDESWRSAVEVGVTVTRGSRTLARGTTRVRPPRRAGTRVTLRAPLTPAGRRAGAGPVRVVVLAFGERLSFPARLGA